MKKRITKIIAITMSIIILSSNMAFASSMKDVSSSHWAYSEITEMQKRGLLVTNSQGQFFPNDYVTYFKFSKLLAKATGYQDEKIKPNMDSALKEEIRANYKEQEPIIKSHEKNYKHWQSDANQEIAYLLGRGYLKEEDLGRFMSRSTSGLESKRGIRRQEVAVYLVSILGKAKTAEKEYTTTGFADETEIGAQHRPYIAYLKTQNLISGDKSTRFRPTDPLTKAELSKLLIGTLKIKEKAEEPEEPKPEPEPEPEEPGDGKTVQGKLTKMISKGDNSYYVVLEVESNNMQTYSLESTAKVVDKNNKTLSLASLKNKFDNAEGNINVKSAVSVIGTTEYVTNLKLVDEVSNTPPEEPKPEPKPEENLGSRSEKGTIHSILIAPVSEVTVQLSDGNKKTYKVTYNTEFYNKAMRREMPIWDLRVNQKVNLDLMDNDIERLVVNSPAPPVTLTGTITRTSTNGDEIDINVAYDSIRNETDVTRTIKVPMLTQITDGKIQRARKDFTENMQVVVVFGEDGDLDPEQIIIISK